MNSLDLVLKSISLNKLNNGRVAKIPKNVGTNLSIKKKTKTSEFDHLQSIEDWAEEDLPPPLSGHTCISLTLSEHDYVLIFGGISLEFKRRY